MDENMNPEQTTDSVLPSGSEPPRGGETPGGNETANADTTGGATAYSSANPNGAGDAGFSAPYQETPNPQASNPGAPYQGNSNYGPAGYPGSGSFSSNGTNYGTAGMGGYPDPTGQAWMRSNNRVIGGVCAGIASRLNIDPVIVRGLAVVGLLFFGFIPLLYGALWLWMPSQTTGRSLWTDWRAGMPNQGGAVAGSILLMCFGAMRMLPQGIVLFNIFDIWDGGGGFEDILAFFFIVLVLCLLLAPLAVVVLVIVHFTNRNKAGTPPAASAYVPGPTGFVSTPQTPAGPAPADGLHDIPEPPTASTTDFAAPPTNFAVPNPSFTVPAAGFATPSSTTSTGSAQPAGILTPRIPGPSRTLSLTVGGLVLLSIFTGILLPLLGVLDPLSSGLLVVGLMTMVLGGGMLVTALQKRRTGWLAVVTPLVILFVTLPLATLGMTVMPQLRELRSSIDWHDFPETFSYQSNDLHPGDELSAVRGSANIDLRDTNPGKPITVNLVNGDVSIYTLPEQNVDLEINLAQGNVTTSTLKDSKWDMSETFLQSSSIEKHRPQYFTMDGNQRVEFEDRTKKYEAANISLGSSDVTKLKIRRDVTLSDGLRNIETKPQTIEINLAHGTVSLYERPPVDLWNGAVLPDGHFLVNYVLNGRDLMTADLEEYNSTEAGSENESSAALREFRRRAVSGNGTIEINRPGGVEGEPIALGGQDVSELNIDNTLTLADIHEGKAGPWKDINQDGFNDLFQPGGSKWKPGDNLFDPVNGTPRSSGMPNGTPGIPATPIPPDSPTTPSPDRAPDLENN
ncbi:PspC domain-containing protein [Mobiluncus sp.]|uniref:PspC domain-containing protein n=1 Tax=Mobiluncus sp. TaxID=47293 RepID=UPI002A90C562|nr:PspC domain-containing protein [Mobiluncus sp.]MDY6077197.1 PspC domain-containing protein [Mobiluncus sp.]